MIIIYEAGEAQKAYDAGEVPVGAVVVIDTNRCQAHNLTERLNVTAHAEIQAITAAANFKWKIFNWLQPLCNSRTLCDVYGRDLLVSTK